MPILHYVLRCGDKGSYQVQLNFQEHGVQRDIGEIEQAHAEMTQLAGFLDLRASYWSPQARMEACVVSSSRKPQLEE